MGFRVSITIWEIFKNLYMSFVLAIPFQHISLDRCDWEMHRGVQGAWSAIRTRWKCSSPAVGTGENTLVESYTELKVTRNPSALGVIFQPFKEQSSKGQEYQQIGEVSEHGQSFFLQYSPGWLFLLKILIQMPEVKNGIRARSGGACL